MTYGEKAVGLDFNLSGDLNVQRIKDLYAEIIDMMHVMQNMTASPEQGDLYTVAITEAQGACMWAEKALTWKD